jgi:hypothetical protein
VLEVVKLLPGDVVTTAAPGPVLVVVAPGEVVVGLLGAGAVAVGTGAPGARRGAGVLLVGDADLVVADDREGEELEPELALSAGPEMPS